MPRRAGFTLLETGSLSVAGNDRTTLTLHIVPESTLPAQEYQGRLVFTAPEGVDLIGGDIPLALELFEPSLSILPAVTSNVSPDSCWDWAPVGLTLHLTSTSTQNEQIMVHLEDMPGVTLSEELDRSLTAANLPDRIFQRGYSLLKLGVDRLLQPQAAALLRETLHDDAREMIAAAAASSGSVYDQFLWPDVYYHGRYPSMLFEHSLRMFMTERSLETYGRQNVIVTVRVIVWPTPFVASVKVT